jgi:hypothetical protein
VISKAITEMSFAYGVVKSRLEERNGKKVQILEELEIYDASDVNWGLNPLTVASLKGRQITKGSQIKQLNWLGNSRRELREFELHANFHQRRNSPEVEEWDRLESIFKQGFIPHSRSVPGNVSEMRHLKSELEAVFGR